MYETGVCETSLKAALTPPLLLMSLGNDGAVCAFTVAGGLCGKRKQWSLLELHFYREPRAAQQTRFPHLILHCYTEAQLKGGVEFKPVYAPLTPFKRATFCFSLSFPKIDYALI